MRVDTIGSGAEAGSARASYALLLACAFLALLICGGLLVYGSARGIDLTDEIFYLVWAREPNAYALIYQPFGYLLHPLFRLVDGDLQTYRLAGFAIAAAAGSWLGWSVAPEGRRRLPFAVYGAAAGLTIFFPWIVTPSYNSAANVGAMLIVAGMLNGFAPRPARQLAGTLAGAAGLCIAFFSKPPLFAIGIAAFCAAALIARHRRAALPPIAAALLGIASLSLFLAPAAIIGLVRRMAATQHILALTNTPLALPAKLVRDWGAVPIELSGAVIAAAASFALRSTRWFRWPAYGTIALSLYYGCDVAGDAIDGGIPDFAGLALTTLAAGYAGVIQDRREVRLAIAAVLLAAPFAVALGTFNNQWAQLNFSMAFPLLALFALASADAERWRRTIASGLSLVAPIGLMLLAALFPYSLPASIFAQQVPVEHPITHSRLLVDEETAAFVQAAQGVAPGALLVDLSGTGPGVAAAIGAKAPILAWLNPATPTWPDVVWSRLGPVEREHAWFVGPVLPLFARSAPARWLAGHQALYCATSLPEMPFWGEERVLQVWRPCGAGGGGGPESVLVRLNQDRL